MKTTNLVKILLLPLLAISLQAEAGENTNGGGAWDFEGSAQPKAAVNLILEATVTFTSQGVCDAGSIAEVAKIATKAANDQRTLEAARVQAKDLTSEQQNCLVQALNLIDAN